MERLSTPIYYIALALALCACAKVTDKGAAILSQIPTDETMPVDTVWSPDSAICIYGWDDQTGGQMIHWSAVYQVIDDKCTATYENLPDWPDEPLSLVMAIHVLPHPTRHLYLFDTYFREWSAVGYLGFITYERKGTTLQRVALVRDEEGQLVNEVGFEYDALEVWPEIIYRWDEPSASIITDGFGSYQWNGEALERVE